MVLALHAPGGEFVPVVAGGAALGFWEIAALILLGLAFLLSKVPVPGFKTAANYLQDRGHDMQSWALDRVNGAVGTLNRLLHQAYVATHNYNAQLGNSADAYVRQAVNLQHHVIPNRAQAAQAHTDAARAQAITYAQQAAGAASHHADQLSQSDRALSGQLHAQETQFAQQLHASESQFAQQLHAAAITYSQQLSQSDRALSGQLHAQALEYAQEVGKQAQGYAQELNRELTQFVQAQTQTLERYVESVDQADKEYARSAVNAAVVPLTGALALTDEAVNVLRNSECMKFCNVLGGIGQLLQGAELAGLLALLAEAYSNPGGAVDLIRSDLEQPAEAALGDVLGLFGIRTG